jgi:predicted nucleic acid-binding protein
MDAAELLNGGATFAIDTSAWWRLSALPHELLRALRDATFQDRMLTTPVVRMEILYSARTSAACVAYDAELSALRMLRNDRAVANTAMSALS